MFGPGLCAFCLPLRAVTGDQALQWMRSPKSKPDTERLFATSNSAMPAG
jgi:hypothetical protein